MTPYIGTATSRIDGVAKVTGAAKYAAEFNVPGLAHGSVVCSTIAKGRITRIDASAAMRVEGVLTVLTHGNRPSIADNDQAYKDDVAPSGSPFRPLYDDKIMFNGQPIALVVAETSEIARFAASLVRVEYDKEAHVTDVYRQRDQAVPPKPPTNPFEAMFAPPKARGAPEQALAAAAVRHEGEYYVPIEHHNPMELFASTVIFEGDGKLTVYDKTQGVQNVQKYLCGVFGMKPEEVRVMSPFVGGGFGAGLRPQFQVVLAVLAARALQRSVRVVLTRQQMYVLGYRPAMIQRIAIGASADGTLDAITHDAVTVTSQYEDHYRQETGWSGLLYKSAHAKYEHRLARLDLPTSCDMRAPSAASAVYALECAMDELAIALELDPLELRVRCYSDRDQHDDRPYSSKALRECYRQGAEAFGWDKRTPEPRSMRDGSELVGWGMATGIWEALQVPITVRIALTADGHAEVACATSDIGTGTYTIMAQVAAGECRARSGRAFRRQAHEQARRLARGVDRRCHATRRPRPHRAGGSAEQPRAGHGGDGPTGRLRRGTSWGSLLEAWAKERQPRERTLYDWQLFIERLIDHLGHDDAERVTKADLIGWKDALLASGKAAKTVRNHVNAVSTLYRSALDNERLQRRDNPAEGVRVASRQGRLKQRLPFTDEEAALILRAARGEEGVKRWVPWLLAFTGARLDEVCQAYTTDIRQDQGVWYLDINEERGKKLKNPGSARKVPLHHAVLDEGVLTYVQSLPEGPLFPDLKPDRFGSPGVRRRNGWEDGSDLWGSKTRGRSRTTVGDTASRICAATPGLRRP